MGLFKSDLYRNFGFGFLIGAALVGAASSDSWSGDLAPKAQAAEVVQPSADFVIPSE